MPGKLALHLPFVPEADRKLLFGSIVAAAQYPRGHPVREGVIQGLSRATSRVQYLTYLRTQHTTM